MTIIQLYVLEFKK